MIGREGVTEVEDGEEDAGELPRGDHQRHREGGTLRCQSVDEENAAVLRENGEQKVKY